MAKAVPDDVLDVYLEEIALADRLYVCSGQPDNFAGIAAVALAEAELTPGDGNSFTIGNGDASGRKVQIAQQSDVEIDTSGTATHIVLADAYNERLIFVTTCTSQALTDSGTVTIPAWDIEVADPT